MLGSSMHALRLHRVGLKHAPRNGFFRRWMSVRPQDVGISEVRKKVTIQSLYQNKANGTPISMLTAYDYPTAVACSSHPVDITLVGDSLAQVCLGYPSTTHLSVAEMIHHTRAVARGTTHPLLIADMPFGSYHTGIEDALRNAVRMVQDGHVEGVKMEGGQELTEIVRRLSSVGIPVMAHVGLLPQRHIAMSGYKVQGRDRISAKRILADAIALQEAGAFSIVLEAIPKELGKYITEKLQIPTIGIGAGPHTDGQVLVWDDMMGTWNGHKAKFVRRFANVKLERDSGVEAYCEAVKSRSFPDENTESYSLDKNEWAQFLEDQKSQ
ncbi:3-methyl-2-oxobutanoate hydroxymethyltransferase [Pleurotus pulmonarius]